MSAVLGCIADDFTGATDLANNLVRAGMRVVMTVDTPCSAEQIDADSLVVALKSRTAPASDAVEKSLEACRWLRQQGAKQIYFKVCSTFDSTAKGNIGPVIEALMDELGSCFSIATPAFPLNARTVVHGHLFVGGKLLSESGMQHHPLTPMTDANLVRVLQAQLRREGKRSVGLIDYGVVGASAEAIRERMDELQAGGTAIAIVDALNQGDLDRLGEALAEEPFLTASSGLAESLPRNWGFQASARISLPPFRGRKIILSGSCSATTHAQVRHFLAEGGQGFAIDPLAPGDETITRAIAWAENCWQREGGRPLLVYSTAEPARVAEVQAALGAARAGALVEQVMAELARVFVHRGAGGLVVAGGETAGVCVQALGIQQLRIGPQIDPGVPWCYAAGLHLALKSGNFGSVDFFEKAFRYAGE